MCLRKDLIGNWQCPLHQGISKDENYVQNSVFIKIYRVCCTNNGTSSKVGTQSVCFQRSWSEIALRETKSDKIF